METRKDIFRFISQGQLELPELIAKSTLNTIEFRANDGIYVNGVRLTTGGGGAPSGNISTVDYTADPPSYSNIATDVPLGRTKLVFDTLGYNFNHLDSTSVDINFTENASKPFSTINLIVPVIRQPNGKGSFGKGIDIQSAQVFDKEAGTFSMTIYFGASYGNADLLAGYTLDIDFLIA